MDPLSNGYADDPGNALYGNQLVSKVSQRYRYLLDKSTPHVYGRWLSLVGQAAYALDLSSCQVQEQACKLFVALAEFVLT